MSDSETNTSKNFTWIVRFDVAPLWVADGFALSDERALSMLASDLCHADMNEIAATVIAGPSALVIAREQGYTKHNSGKIVRDLLAGAPNAHPSKSIVSKALFHALTLIDSVAFVKDESDNTQEVISELRAALALIQGATPMDHELAAVAA